MVKVVRGGEFFWDFGDYDEVGADWPPGFFADLFVVAVGVAADADYGWEAFFEGFGHEFVATFEEVLVAVAFPPGEYLVVDFRQGVGAAHCVCDVGQIGQIDAFLEVPALAAFQVGGRLVAPGGYHVGDAGPAVGAGDGVEGLAPFLAAVLECV